MEPRLAHAELLQLALDRAGKLRTDVAAARRELCRALRKVTRKGGNLPIELYHIRIVIVDRLQLRTHGCEPLEHGGYRSAVFLFQTVDHVHPRLEAIQTRGIGVETIAVVAHLIGRLLQGDIRLFDHALRIREAIVVPRNLVEIAAHDRERGQHRRPCGAVLAEPRARLGCIVHELFHMRETANLRFEFFVLSLLQLGIADLLLLPAQHIQALANFLHRFRAFFTQRALFSPRIVYAAICRKKLGERAVSVLEQTALAILAQERKVLILSVDVHEKRGKTA